MNFDRGFIKWQPFNSVISSKELLQIQKKEEKCEKPILSNEQIEALNQQIIEAYLSHNQIKICFYEENHITSMEASITKIIANTQLIELNHHKFISFYQIIGIS